MEILDAANYLIELSQESKEYSVSLLKLQKILYFIKGLSFAKYNYNIFEDQIFEAWRYGPTNIIIHNRFKNFGSKNLNEVIEPHYKNISDLEKEIIKDIWDKSKHYTGMELSKQTQNDSLWIDKFNSMNDQMGDEEIRDFFTKNYI